MLLLNVAKGLTKYLYGIGFSEESLAIVGDYREGVGDTRGCAPSILHDGLPSACYVRVGNLGERVTGKSIFSPIHKIP
jgi:hypothetical protein